MLTFDNFTGINNVLPPERLGASQLTEARNVDVGLSGELRRRGGYSQAAAGDHRNLWQADGYLLATVAGDLTTIHTGGSRAVVRAGLGDARVWYCNLPDGRTAFANGQACGITDGSSATPWGVPTPTGYGSLAEVAGALMPGDYQYQLTYVRLADGLEGAPLAAPPVRIEQGGMVLTGLPALAGYAINVYLTSHHGGTPYLAGKTSNGLFSFTGKNDALVLPCRTEHLTPAPAGTLAAFWRGRVLLADGKLLLASRTNQWEAFDLRRDFKQFTAPITLIQPVDDGIYVGTERELVFLAGVEFDKLAFQPVLTGRVVLGSGAAVRGERIRVGKGTGNGSAMVCIADGGLVAGFNQGAVVLLSEGVYATDVLEVAATFRMVNGIPQYLAIPQ